MLLIMTENDVNPTINNEKYGKKKQIYRSPLEYVKYRLFSVLIFLLYLNGNNDEKVFIIYPSE